MTFKLEYDTPSSTAASDTDSQANSSPRLQDFTKFSLYWAALVSTCLVSFFIAASHMTVKPLQFQAPISSIDDWFTADVTLTAEAVSVDPISRTIVMNWYPALTSTTNCSSNAHIVTDIYLTNMLLDTSSPSWTAQPADGDHAAFRLNGTEWCLGLVHTYPSFRTVTKLVASKEYLLVQSIGSHSSLQSYPFDVYLAPFSFYTRNVNTGTVSAPKVTDAFGIAVNFKISLLNTFLSYTDVQKNLQFYLRIERSRATKVFVVMVAVTNWLTAIAFLTICAAAFIYPEHQIYGEMFVVPAGAVFAFTSIRANLPGAPAGFGTTIDLYTILPVLVIMSFCSFALLLIILHRRILYWKLEKKRQESQDNERTTEQYRCDTPNENGNMPYTGTEISQPEFRFQQSSSNVLMAEQRNNAVNGKHPA
ncbi:hypothetical protein BDZ97DRAFT_1828358 [Flammula alnicola]|nr:hypothetical protein BDZ97DRAFT_1828358 [Flammula alnicola]